MTNIKEKWTLRVSVATANDIMSFIQFCHFLQRCNNGPLNTAILVNSCARLRA